MTDALKAVRRVRNLRQSEVARRMGLEPRAYARFEAAEGAIDLERLFLFAEVTDSDPMALVAAIVMDRSEIAERCCNSKAALVQTHALDRFVSLLGPASTQVTTAALISAQDQALQMLIDDLGEQARFASAWLSTSGDILDGRGSQG